MNYERFTEYLPATSKQEAIYAIQNRLFEIVDTKFPGKFELIKNRTNSTNYTGKCIAQIDANKTNNYTFTTCQHNNLTYSDLWLSVTQSSGLADSAHKVIDLNANPIDGAIKLDYMKAELPNGLFLKFYNKYDVLQGIIAILKDPLDQDSFMIRSHREVENAPLYSMKNSATINASISLPTPEINKVFMCNDMKNGEVLKDWFSYNSNPSTVGCDFFYFGGQRYLTLTDKLCIKA